MVTVSDDSDDIRKETLKRYKYAIDYDIAVIVDLSFFVIEQLFGFAVIDKSRLHLTTFVEECECYGRGELRSLDGKTPIIRFFREGMDEATTKFLVVIHECMHYIHWERNGLQETKLFCEFIAMTIEIAVAEKFDWVQQGYIEVKPYKGLNRLINRKLKECVESVKRYLSQPNKKNKKIIDRILEHYKP